MKGHRGRQAGLGRSTPVRIAVIDSGWDRRLKDSRVEQGCGFVAPPDELTLTRSDDDRDQIGHGTACADIVLQVAPEAAIVPLRVFGARLETSIDVIVAAIDEAVRVEARIANLSLATFRPDALAPFRAATERARKAGVIVIASASNGQGGGYPSTFPAVLGVDIRGTGDPFAVSYDPSFDAEYSLPDAPRIARGLFGRRVRTRGTSFAAPVVSGRVANFLAVSPSATLDEVREFLAAGAPLTAPTSPD